MDKPNNAHAWSIDYSVEKQCVYISTNDYHADPLTLSTDQLRNMLQILDPNNKPVTLSTDMQEGKNQISPFYGISKREKSFYIGIPDGWSGLLKFTRLDLYRFASMMNKRVKIGKKSVSH